MAREWNFSQDAGNKQCQKRKKRKENFKVEL